MTSTKVSRSFAAEAGIDPQMEAPPTLLFLYLPIGYTLQFHVFLNFLFLLMTVVFLDQSFI